MQLSGTHIIIDISKIANKEVLKYEATIIPFLDDISQRFQLNVVKKAIHQFQPYGVTGVYILSESHLSVHTFVDEKKLAMDLYTCSKFTKVNELIEYLKECFVGSKIEYKVIDRLHT